MTQQKPGSSTQDAPTSSQDFGQGGNRGQVPIRRNPVVHGLHMRRPDLAREMVSALSDASKSKRTSNVQMLAHNRMTDAAEAQPSTVDVLDVVFPKPGCRHELRCELAPAAPRVHGKAKMHLSSAGPSGVA